MKKPNCKKKWKLLKAVRYHCYKFCDLMPEGLDHCYQEDCPLYPYLDKAGKD